MFFISFDTGSGTYGDVYKVLKFSLIFKSVSPLLTIICCVSSRPNGSPTMSGQPSKSSNWSQVFRNDILFFLRSDLLTVFISIISFLGRR